MYVKTFYHITGTYKDEKFPDIPEISMIKYDNFQQRNIESK